MRNLKILGLALVAAFAMSAVAASAASAETDAIWTASGSTLAHDTPMSEGGTGELTVTVGFKCLNATYDYVSSSGSALTLTPTFAGCKTSGGAPITITHEGCHYNLVLGTKEGHTAPVTAALTCPVGKKIQVHIYGNAAHTFPVCTIQIGEQGGLVGLIAHDLTNGHTRITGTLAGVQTHQAGPVCNLTSEPEAELHVDMTGTNLGLH